MFATLCMAISLIFWFYVGRWLFRLVVRHPQTSMALLRGAVRMIRR